MLCTQADKWKLSRSLLAHGMCNFEDETRAAIPREYLFGEGVLCTQAVKRTLVQGVLNGMCIFEDETRAARRRAIAQTALW